MLSALMQSASLRLCQFASRLTSHKRSLIKTLQEKNYSTNKKKSEKENFDPSGNNWTNDTSPTTLTAEWKWVVRGKYKVAAFSAVNNPAFAIVDENNQHWHRHKCPNCLTVYDHTHPYGSLHHPQHIKDCPKCKVLAPSDLKISDIP